MPGRKTCCAKPGHSMRGLSTIGEKLRGYLRDSEPKDDELLDSELEVWYS